MKISNLRIGARLGAGFAVMLLALAGLGALTVHSLSSGFDTLDRTVNRDAVKLEATLEVQNWVRANSRRIFELAVAPDEAARKHVLERMASNSENNEKAEQRLTALVASPEGKALLGKILAAKSVTRASYKKVEDLAVAGKQKEALEVVQKETDGLINAYNAALLEMVKHQRKTLEKSVATARADYEQTRNVTIGMVSGIVLLGVLFAWLVTRSITRPVGEAKLNLETIANGDLTVRIEARSADELGQMTAAMAQMQQQLVATVGRIRTASESIGTASGEIAAGNADLSSRTEEQASSLEETASSMEELTSTVKQNAENARQANQLAAGASEVAAKGGAAVSEVVATMNSISGSSRKIADIISVIDGIAFQTNILALNAAVEAARAGEQGRGFAVVASEVRSLAQKSAGAAKEIKTLIEDSVAKVEAGSRQVNDAGRTMEEIVASVKRVSDIMGEITAASQEQSAGIEQVNQAITQMDQVTQQNAALVEEAAAAAESLKEQARGLVTTVSVFKVAADAGHGALPEGRPAAPQAAGATASAKHAKGAGATASVTRLGARGRPAAKPAAEAGGRVQATGTDGDWQEF